MLLSRPASLASLTVLALGSSALADEPAAVTGSAPAAPATRLALGAGWALPGDLEFTTGAVLRVRTAGGWVVQPGLFFGVSHQSLDDTDPDDGQVYAGGTSVYAGLHTAFERSLGRRGPVELFVGPTLTGGYNWFDPEGSETQRTMSLALGWQLEVELWVAPWLSVTAAVGSSIVYVDHMNLAGGHSTNISAGLSVGDGAGRVLANVYF